MSVARGDVQGAVRRTGVLAGGRFADYSSFRSRACLLVVVVVVGFLSLLGVV